MNVDSTNVDLNMEWHMTAITELHLRAGWQCVLKFLVYLDMIMHLDCGLSLISTFQVKT